MTVPERDRYLDAAPIFLEAVALPPRQRDAWVRRACGTDEELLREVLTLLEFDFWAANTGAPTEEYGPR